MPEIWAKGNCRLTVPETIRIVAAGRRYRGVYAVDVALSIIKQLGVGGAEGRVIEYVGGIVSQMTIGERFALANLSSEMGAIASVCTYDATTRRYLTGRTMSRYQPVLPDKDAEYHELYQVNIDKLTPQIACQGKFDDIRPVAEVEGTPVQHVVLGSCTAGRFEDLRVAAEVLKGKHVHDDCRLMIVPGSRSVYLEALKKGLVRVFVEAGAMIMNPASCPGMLLSDRFLAAGERCLSTTNMYFTRRDNSNKSDIYLCSPATAAVSALNGGITDPTRFVR
jgi:3-isopropylmalate/(R)-2-methylmalate dehydratase large subunit